MNGQPMASEIVDAVENLDLGLSRLRILSANMRETHHYGFYNEEIHRNQKIVARALKVLSWLPEEEYHDE